MSKVVRIILLAAAMAALADINWTLYFGPILTSNAAVKAEVIRLTVLLLVSGLCLAGAYPWRKSQTAIIPRE